MQGISLMAGITASVSTVLETIPPIVGACVCCKTDAQLAPCDALRFQDYSRTFHHGYHA
jgi:hypothetical protein